MKLLAQLSIAAAVFVWAAAILLALACTALKREGTHNETTTEHSTVEPVDILDVICPDRTSTTTTVRTR